MKQPVLNLDAKKIEELEMPSDIFDIKIDHDLLYQVITSQASNKRKHTAHTKVRSEVRGGGRKPWSQKGTGNARAGSIRSPIFRGGGITFGPRNTENFKKKINKKVITKALLISFSSKIKDKELIIIDKYDLAKPNTKKIASFIEKAHKDKKHKSGLMLAVKKNESLKRSLKNIKWVDFGSVKSVSALDLLNRKYLYLDKESLNYFIEKFSKINNASAKQDK